MADEWMDAETACRAFRIHRATLFRRLKLGEFETANIGGKRMYRAAVTRGPDATALRQDATAQVPATQVLALVERYEVRIDTLLAERRELAGQVGTLAIEVERQRAAVQATQALAQAAAQLAAVEARHVAEQLAAERDRARAELRVAVETAERLRTLPWWRFGERRQLRSMLSLPA